MNKYLIKVTGKNINNFLMKVAKEKINILNVSFINSNEINILIIKNDFEILERIKGIYEYEIIKEYGKKNLYDFAVKNIHLFILIIINIILIGVISNYIYEVEVVENDQELKDFITETLNQKGIKKLSKKPTDLEKIKNEILEENKSKIEWLEIIESGIKYIVKVEERIDNKSDAIDIASNIVAKKDGIIKKVIASSGKVLVEKEMVVKKGDILITGLISEEEKVRSSGNIYANVWYKVESGVSLHTKIHELTKNSKKGIRIRFFNRNFELYKKYKTNEIKERIIFKNDILPIYLSIDEIIETNEVDHILTFEEAKDIAIKNARKKFEDKLKVNEKIISENELKVMEKDSKIIVEILFTVYEDISEEKRIEVLNVSRDYRSSY